MSHKPNLHMDLQARERLEARAGVIKALAHPTRLFLVEEIAREPRCVCDLTEMVGDDVSTVSKHLTLLKQAGVLEAQRKGTKVFYRLKVPCVLGFFQCVEGVLEAQAERQQRVLAPRRGSTEVPQES